MAMYAFKEAVRKERYLIVAGIVICSVFLGCDVHSAEQLQFTNTVPFFEIGEVAGLTKGDFNEDGFDDVAMGRSYANYVAVQFGGLSGLSEPVPILSGVGPVDVASGDFNGDGHCDLVSIDYNDNPNHGIQSFSLMLGNGKGGFSMPVATPLDSEPVSVVVDNFNQDTYPDILIVTDDQELVMYPGNGNGTFGAPVITSFPMGVKHLDFGDLEADGDSDCLFLTTYSSVYLGVNNGSGSFLWNEFETDSYLSAASFGYVDADTVLDLIFMGNIYTGYSESEYGRQVYLGNGDGTFGSELRQYVTENVSAPWLIVADINSDNHGDIIGGEIYSLIVSFGDGTGLFSSPRGFLKGNVSSDSSYAVAGDFNGDGHIDVVTNYEEGISFLAGNGDGTFEAVEGIRAGSRRRYGSVGDFNGDKILDIVVSSGGTTGELPSDAVLMGTGGGTFSKPLGVSNVWSHQAIIGNMDNDRNGV